MNNRDLDAEFERIIAGWDTEAVEPVPGTARRGADEVDAASRTDLADPDQSTQPDEPRDADKQHDEYAEHREPQPDNEPKTEHEPGADGAGPDSTPVSDPTGNTLPIGPGAASVWRGPSPSGGTDDAVPDRAASDDHDAHFVPPIQTDLPTAEEDPMFWAIVVGLAGGPLLLLYALFFDRGGSPWWVVTALTMIVGGFVLLVLRGGMERDPSDDGTRI